MNMLYDSDNYVVVWTDVNAGQGARRDGYEIVDKLTNREVYLDGDWAAVFTQQIRAWEENTPTPEEVEKKLEAFCHLAQIPLMLH